MIFTLFMPLITSGAPASCHYGTTGAYLAPHHTENLGDLCWYVSFDINTMNAPDDKEVVSILRLQEDGAGGYLHQWYGNKENLYPAFGAPEFNEIIQSRLGSVWIVGNEMENPEQDNIRSDIYALAYHDAYHAIKAADPSAMVAVGAVTSLNHGNIQYLRWFIEHYQNEYGSYPPVDIWTIHTYNTIPLSSADNLDLLDSQLDDFFDFMNVEYGYHVPVWVTEFGILPPADYVDEAGRPFTPERARIYMQGAVDLFYDYGIDRWAWWNAYVSPGHPGDSGNLVHDNGELTELGRFYMDMTEYR